MERMLNYPKVEAKVACKGLAKAKDELKGKEEC